MFTGLNSLRPCVPIVVDTASSVTVCASLSPRLLGIVRSAENLGIGTFLVTLLNKVSFLTSLPIEHSWIVGFLTTFSVSILAGLLLWAQIHFSTCFTMALLAF